MAEPRRTLVHRRLPGVYADSLVLMQLQRAIEALPGIDAAAAVMATAANRELLADRGLLPSDADPDLRADDLLVVVRAAGRSAAEAALARVEALLAERRPAGPSGEHRPRSLRAGLAALPEARWVLVSVPGRWAAGVAREALAAGRHVFLFSDNVPLADEVALKAEAARRGLLVLGPDCGTAIVGGVGLGFANRVRRGGIGLVAASGTGLQAVACGIDARGGGVSQALGTGGRDLSAEVGGATARAALDLLARDPETRVIVLVSKPPDPTVAARLLAAARATDKPVVVWFLAAAPPARRVRNLWFAVGSDEAAELAVELARSVAPEGAGGAARSTAPQGSAEAAGEDGAVEGGRGRGTASLGAAGAATGQGTPSAETARQEEVGGSPEIVAARAGTNPPGGVGTVAGRVGDPTTATGTTRAPIERTRPGEDDAGGTGAPACGERPIATPRPASPTGGWLCGLFSGGTLATEALAGLAPFLAPLASNLSLPGVRPIAARAASGRPAGTPAAATGEASTVVTGARPSAEAPSGTAGGSGGAAEPTLTSHLVLDLGADEFTAGRPHPMLDPSSVAERLREAAADSGVAILLFDVVLGDGAHPDPAAELAPAVADALAAGRPLDAVAILVGTEADSQDRTAQAERLAAAGARVTSGVAEAIRYALDRLQPPVEEVAVPVPLAAVAPPLAAVNVGLPAFAAALAAQGALVVEVDWRPPAGGDERLARILERAGAKR